MKSAYLAISYKCNQHCSFCPCSKKESQFPFSDIEQLKKSAKDFVENQGVEMIVVSGGEPTIHPGFHEILTYITKTLYCCVTILSNGERYYNQEFVNKIQEIGTTDKITAITTLHSQNSEEHELINGSKGSLARSIQGLKNMYKIGVDVIVKHCITVDNYKDLLEYYKFIDAEFPEGVCLQLCSIDYCGIDEADLEANMLSFVELQPYLEEMFNYYIQKCEEGSTRHMYAINMPFCSCDPYYWNILVGRADTYLAYGSVDGDGKIEKIDSVSRNVDTFGSACRNCQAVEICPGTYKTAFDYFGNRIVQPYLKEQE